MKKMLSVIIFIICSLLLISCNKKESDTTTPVIVTKQSEENKVIKDELENVKKIIASTKSFTGVENSEVTSFIKNNQNTSDIKNDLCKFVLEKYNDYLKTNPKSAITHDNLKYVLEIIYTSKANNEDIEKAYKNISYEDELSKVKKDISIKENTTSKNLTSKDGNLELVNSSSDGEYILGSIKNNSNLNYKYVEVNINLYDNHDNQVGSTIANINNLEGKNSWNFKAPILEKSASKFKVINISTN